jgi:copper chaperone NosL
MVYQPPLIGSKMLLNFKAISYPHWGGLAMFASLVLGFASLWTDRAAKSLSSFGLTTVTKAAAGIALLLFSCSKEPQPISYGNDGCHYCKMTAVDARFGAEWVSVKGKNYKFDAVECLLGYLQNTDNSHTYSIWVTPFDNPNKLIESSNSMFLISEELPSPMGMYLTAFETQSSAQTHQQKYGGELYNWDQLQMRFTELDENI